MTEQVSILVIGDERLKLGQAGAIIEEEVRAATVEASLWLEAGAKLHAPKRTSNLARNIRGNIERVREPGVGPASFRVKVEVGEGAPYGVYVHYGTGIYHRPDPHTPWGAKPPRRFLRWEDPKTGHPVFARQVKGMRARPFIDESLEENRERIVRRFEEVGHRITLRLNA